MKKIFIYMLIVLCICMTGCKSKAKEYQIQYNSDGYIIDSFNLSDIKIKVTEGKSVEYVSLTEDMLDKAYAFDKPGEYEINIHYEDYKETIKITLEGTRKVLNNGYKEVTALYTAFSGATLTDRVPLEEIGTTLYVGNTFGLEQNVEYTSSDETIIRINENNVLICLKRGKATISAGEDVKVKISVEEMELTASNYYSTIGYLPEMSSSDIKTIIHNIIDEHTKCSYTYLKTILPLSDADPENPNNMILLYTGRSQGGEIAQNNEPDGWNREHVWPLSELGGSTSLTAGCDAHHIRPADLSINNRRGNMEYGIGSMIVEDTYASGSSKCKISSEYFEPRDEVKGDIARMLFYMAVRYEGDVSDEADLELVLDKTAEKDYKIGNLSVLLAWNRMDPVDEFEMHRNDVIYSYQKNRNPFIDYPSLADLIWSQEK